MTKESYSFGVDSEARLHTETSERTGKQFNVLEVRFGEYRITDKGTIISISDACNLLNKYNITCKELEGEVELLSDFILSKGYTLDDFNKYLCNKWSDVK